MKKSSAEDDIKRRELFDYVTKPDAIKHYCLSGDITWFFPDFLRMNGLHGRGIYHEEDVFSHTLAVHDIVCKYSSDRDLCLAALLHDYGKIYAYNPDTKRFSKHEKIGEKVLLPLLVNRVYKKEQAENALRVSWFVRYHMWDRDSSHTDKQKKWLKFFRSMFMHNVCLYEHLLLRYADMIGRKVNGQWIYMQKSELTFHEWVKTDSTWKCWLWYKEHQEGIINDNG